MAFCLRHMGMFLFLMLMSLVVQQTTASGQSEVWFISYSANCREDINNNACDPKFTFCLGRPGATYLSSSNCVYGLTGQGGHYQNQNYINFENQGIYGLSNPWILSTPKFYDTSVMLVVKIVDDDTFDDDDLQTLSQIVRPTVAASKESAQWSEQTMSSGGYTIQFRIRLYCDQYYYTSSCDVYCKAQDTSTGHYTCQDGTGKKICLPGWKGVNCNEDIDECQPGFCKMGVCTNLPGDVRCDYTENYTETTTTVTTTHMPTIVSTPDIMDNTSVGLHTAQDLSTKQSEISVWVIALIVIISLVAVLLVVLLIFCIRRRSKQRENDTSEVSPSAPPLSVLSSFDAKDSLYAHTLDETKPPKISSRITSIRPTPTTQVPNLPAKPVRAEANHYTTLNVNGSKQRQNDTSEVSPSAPPLSVLSSFDAKDSLYAHTLDKTKPPKISSRITSSTPTTQVPSLPAKPVRAEGNHYTTLNDIASQNKYNEEKLYEDIDIRQDDSSPISKR